LQFECKNNLEDKILEVIVDVLDVFNLHFLFIVL